MKILKIFLALSLLPQILLVKLLSQYPEKVELYFSQKIYLFSLKIPRLLFEFTYKKITVCEATNHLRKTVWLLPFYPYEQSNFH